MNDITTSQPWWRYPMVWMVIAGPAMVVVAGVVTMFLAMSSPDPVLDTRTHNITQAPAVQARNHAAAGSLPGRP